MIGYIEGTIKVIRKNYIIVATDYVGYKAYVTPQVLLSLTPAQKVSFYVYTYVREDQLTLYGFSTPAELEFFETLIGISGIGPRNALAIMSIGDLSMIKGAIAKQDAAAFTKVPGVGRKTAERLIVELKEKVLDGGYHEGVAVPHTEVVDVLMALGYSRTEARQALEQVPGDIEGSEEKIKYALRSLAKQ